METVKTLLENTKQDLKMKLWWAEEHDKEPQHTKEIPVLKQKIADIDEALLRLFNVVGQSEQFFAFLDWYYKPGTSKALLKEYENWLKYKGK